MKRFVLFIAIAMLMAGCANSFATGDSQRMHPHHHGSFDDVVLAQIPASRMFYETTLAGLEYRAANIVRGRMGNDARIVFQTDDFQGGHNVVSFEIYEVIKGDLSAGQTIRIVEPYIIKDDILLTYANYLPSTPYHEYFFFLGAQLPNHLPEGFAGSFITIHGERSRFPVPDAARASIQAFNADELALGAYADTEVYMSIWQEVIAAYMN